MIWIFMDKERRLFRSSNRTREYRDLRRKREGVVMYIVVVVIVCVLTIPDLS